MTSYSLAFEAMDRDLSVTRYKPLHHFRNHFYKIAFLLFDSFYSLQFILMLNFYVITVF